MPFDGMGAIFQYGKVMSKRREGMTMSIMRLEPFEDIRKMRREVDRLLEDVFGGRLVKEPIPFVTEWVPPVEMFETDNEVIVKAALPNIDPKHVDITVTNEAITLKGETKHEDEQKGRNYFRRELVYGTFLRTLPLLTEVKGTEAKATYKDGVLEVKVPKSERAKATSVKVKIEP
jgi:HSP20 family protein